MRAQLRSEGWILYSGGTLTGGKIRLLSGRLPQNNPFTNETETGVYTHMGNDIGGGERRGKGAKEAINTF